MKMTWTQGNGEESGEGDGKEKRFRHFASPFRVSEEKPPSFFDGHFCGVMRWGQKVGWWAMGNSILGTDAFQEKDKR
jgi:hypothetical protein